MNVSFSRAAWIQWFAFAVDWNGFVTWTQSHFSEPSSRSRIIFVMWLPTLGFSVLGRQLPELLASAARCFGLATTMSAGRRWAKVPTSRPYRRPRAGR